MDLVRSQFLSGQMSPPKLTGVNNAEKVQRLQCR